MKVKNHPLMRTGRFQWSHWKRRQAWRHQCPRHLGENIPRPKSAIPVGTQFSPDLIGLREFLKVIVRHSGDKPKMMQAAWQAPVRLLPVDRVPTRRRASLPLEAARQYGLLSKDYLATDLAVRLSAMPAEAAHREFAKHILLNCGGLRVLEGIRQMEIDRPLSGRAITGDSLAEYLTKQGFRVTIHNTAINTMRLWLARAGIFPDEGWTTNEAARDRILGMAGDEIDMLVSLSADQQAFLRALCRLPGNGPYLAAQVRATAEAVVGRTLDRTSLPKLMDPLQLAGYLEYKTGGTAEGKSAKVWKTAKFSTDLLQPFLENAVRQLDGTLTKYYTMDFGKIHDDLTSKDRFVKGQALEAYAVQVMRILGLRLLHWRLRGAETGGSEIDVIMAGVMGGVPTRWQIQCKNTAAKVGLEEVAKEVGLAPLTKATHILMFSTSRFSSEARRYAHEVMRNSPVTIFLLGEDEFQQVRKSSGAELLPVLAAQSRQYVEIERVGLEHL